MTCAVLAVPDVSRVGGGAQAPRAAVPIPDTLTFPRCVCGASPSVPAPAWRPLRAPACVTAAEVWSVLFISGSPAWRPLQARGTCYSRGSVEHPLQSQSWHGAPSGHRHVLQQRKWGASRSVPVPAWRPLRAPARVTAAEVWPSCVLSLGSVGSAASWGRLLTAGLCFRLRRHLGKLRYCVAGCGLS